MWATSCLGFGNFGYIDRVCRDYFRKLLAHSFFSVLIGECIVCIEITGIDESCSGFVNERVEVIPTVVIVVLHYLLSLLDHPLYSGVLFLFSAVLFSLFGVCGK